MIYSCCYVGSCEYINSPELAGEKKGGVSWYELDLEKKKKETT